MGQIYRRTGDARYRLAAEELLARLRAHPRNAVGGFWHKGIYPYQMWVDGIYMAGPFCVRHARIFGPNDLCPDEALYQTALKRRKIALRGCGTRCSIKATSPIIG